MNIKIKKIENNTIELLGQTTKVFRLVKINYSDADEGSYIIHNPTNNNNIQANTLAEMQSFYNQILVDINRYQESANSPLIFDYPIFTNGFPYNSTDNSPEPFALEIL